MLDGDLSRGRGMCDGVLDLVFGLSRWRASHREESGFLPPWQTGRWYGRSLEWGKGIGVVESGVPPTVRSRSRSEAPTTAEARGAPAFRGRDGRNPGRSGAGSGCLSGAASFPFVCFFLFLVLFLMTVSFVMMQWQAVRWSVLVVFVIEHGSFLFGPMMLQPRLVFVAKG